MSWRYKYHRDARFGFNHEKLDDCPERVTKLSFDRWLTLYNGDPEHWIICQNSNYESGRCPYRLPVYKMNQYTSNKYRYWEYRYIKFLTASDYAKFNMYMDDLLASGEDYQNLKEIEELATYIGKIAEERLREAQERTQRAIEENEKLRQELKLKIKAEGNGGKVYELSF